MCENGINVQKMKWDETQESGMEQAFCSRYGIVPAQFRQLLARMQPVGFAKGALVVKEGELHSDFYLIGRGIWRAWYWRDGTDVSLWFAERGQAAFSSWGYVENSPARISIESVTESVALRIGKAELEALFGSSLEMANVGRRIFECEILDVDRMGIRYGCPKAGERYRMLMREHPELLQQVPLKYIASYLDVTPQSLSRIRARMRG